MATKMNGNNIMHNYKTKENNIAPDARDFLGGNYLRKEDVTGPINVTIESVRSVEVPNADRNKLVIWFREIGKPLILNKTNTTSLVDIFRNTNTATWIGGRITLYNEASVQFGGNVVGGIRIQPVVVAETLDVRNVVHLPMANGHHTSEPDMEESDSFGLA